MRRLETIDPPSQATRRCASTALERNEELLRYSQTSHSFLEQRGHDAKGSPARESCCSLPQPPMDSGSSVIMFPCSHSPSSFARDPMESGREVRRLPASPRRLRAVRRLMLSGRLVKKLPVADSSCKYWDETRGSGLQQCSGAVYSQVSRGKHMPVENGLERSPYMGAALCRDLQHNARKVSKHPVMSVTTGRKPTRHQGCVYPSQNRRNPSFSGSTAVH